MKLTPLLLVSLAAILMVGLSGLVRADPSIAFRAAWSKTVTDTDGDLAAAQSITVALLSGDFVVVAAVAHDCTANTDMDLTVSTFGSAITQRNSTVRTAQCGTVDNLMSIWTGFATASVTTITVTQTNAPVSNYFAFTITVTATTGVGSVGSVKAASIPGGSPKILTIVKSSVLAERAIGATLWTTDGTSASETDFLLVKLRASGAGSTAKVGSMQIMGNTTTGNTPNCADGSWCVQWGIATGSFSGTYAIIELLAPFTPPDVETLAATMVGTNSAKLNGNVTDTGDETNVTVYFEWGDTIDLGNATANQTKNSTGTFSDTILGLTVYVTYYFRACVFGPDSETTVCGDTLTFATAFNEIIQNAINYTMILVFVAALTLILVLAYKMKRRGEG